jgi:hypothetical protein
MLAVSPKSAADLLSVPRTKNCAALYLVAQQLVERDPMRINMRWSKSGFMEEGTWGRGWDGYAQKGREKRDLRMRKKVD